MVRRHRVLIAVGALIGLLAPYAQPAAADPVADAKRRLEEINAEIDRLEEVSAVAAEDYDEAVHDSEDLATKIVATGKRIAEQEAALLGIQSAVRDAALKQLVGGGAGGLEALLGSNNLTEQVQRNQYTELAVAAGADVADQLDAALTDLDADRTLLGEQKKESEALAKRIAERKKFSEQQLVKYQQLLESAKAEYGEAKLEQARQEYIERQEAKAKAEADRRARERANRPPPQPRSDNNSDDDNGGGDNGGGDNGGGDNGGGDNGGENGGGDNGGDDGGGDDGGDNGGGGGDGGGGDFTPPPPSPGASGAVAAAMSQIGVPYRYATSSPGVSFDCSGLTLWAWSQAGVSIPRVSRAQYAALPKVNQSDVQPGDLIFFYSPISHVAMYIGGGQMVHAPNTGSHVKVAAVRWARVTGIARPG